MRLKLPGFTIYIFTFLFILTLGLFIVYRFYHPLVPFNELLQIQPTATFNQGNPCLNSLINGNPYSPSGEWTIELIIYCPDGTTSTNILRSDALPLKATAKDALLLVSQINNFLITIDENNLISGLGSIYNDKKFWKITANTADITKTAQNFVLKKGNIIEVKYQ
jgi:hypothetical protein